MRTIEFESPISDRILAGPAWASYRNEWLPHHATIRSGWPLPCLQGGFWYPDGCQELRPDFFGNGVRRTPSGWGSFFQYHPQVPILMGQLGNTIFVAAITFGIMMLVQRIVKRIHAWRARPVGPCPTCTDDWRGLDRCPECGAQGNPAVILLNSIAGPSAPRTPNPPPSAGEAG